MEETTRIYFNGGDFLRVAPYLETYLGYKRIDLLMIFDPGTGTEILKVSTYNMGAPLKNEDREYVSPVAGVSVNIPVRLKKSNRKDGFLKQTKKPAAMFAINKDWYSTVSKSLDLYIPLIDGMSLRAESRKRIEYDYATHDDVTYSLRLSDIPLLWMTVEENQRLSPRNRIYNELGELGEKYKSLLEVSYITLGNAVEYIELAKGLAKDIEAILAKIPEYEQEGDIPIPESS